MIRKRTASGWISFACSIFESIIEGLYLVSSIFSITDFIGSTTLITMSGILFWPMLILGILGFLFFVPLVIGVRITSDNTKADTMLKAEEKLSKQEKKFLEYFEKLDQTSQENVRQYCERKKIKIKEIAANESFSTQPNTLKNSANNVNNEPNSVIDDSKKPLEHTNPASDSSDKKISTTRRVISESPAKQVTSLSERYPRFRLSLSAVKNSISVVKMLPSITTLLIRGFPALLTIGGGVLTGNPFLVAIGISLGAMLLLSTIYSMRRNYVQQQKLKQVTDNSAKLGKCIAFAKGLSHQQQQSLAPALPQQEMIEDVSIPQENEKILPTPSITSVSLFKPHVEKTSKPETKVVTVKEIISSSSSPATFKGKKDNDNKRKDNNSTSYGCGFLSNYSAMDVGILPHFVQPICL